MADDTQRRGLTADLARRLALAPIDDLRLLDRIEHRLAQQRFVWLEHDAPPVTERCLTCQRRAWRETDLDPLIAAVLEQLAADDRALANLREAARAEMLGEGG